MGAAIHQELQHGGTRRVAHQGGDFGKGINSDHDANLGADLPVRHGQ